LMFEQMASNFSFPVRTIFRQILKPRLNNLLCKAIGKNASMFSPLFHNTVNATIVQGGDKINVIPSKIKVDLDGRLLPGFTPEDLIRELVAVIGVDIEIEVVNYDPCPGEPDMGLFDTLGKVLVELDTEAIPIPMMLTAVTDARFFSRLGIQTYGYTPMQLPEDMSFTRVIHGANERIPIEALNFGTEAIFQVLQRFHG